MWLLAILFSILSICQYYYEKHTSHKYYTSWGTLYPNKKGGHVIVYHDSNGINKISHIKNKDTYFIVDDTSIPIYIDKEDENVILPRKTYFLMSATTTAVMAVVLWMYIFLSRQYEVASKMVDYNNLQLTTIRLTLLKEIGGLYSDSHIHLFEMSKDFINKLDSDYISNMTREQSALYTKCQEIIVSLT